MATHTTPLRFTSVGHGNAVCANHVLALLAPDSAPSKRLLSQAKKTGTYLDATSGKGQRSLLLVADGKLVGSALSVATMMKRLNAANQDDAGEEESE